MGEAWMLAAVVVAVGMVGVVFELPKILSHHINQPVQRRLREAALRKKLAAMAIGVAAAACLTYALLTRLGG